MKEGWSQKRNRKYIVIFCISCSNFFRCYGVKESAKKRGVKCRIWEERKKRATCVCGDCIEGRSCLKGEKIQSLEELLKEEEKGNVILPPSIIFREWNATSLEELWRKIREMP